MKASRTALGGVWIIEPRVFSDARGFFFETYQEARFAELGIITRFVQDNHSRSIRGSLRGLHYQLHHPQAKLCRVIIGEVVDVVADIRQGSPTFGKWISVVLSAENKREIFVPKGFAHGFTVLSDSAEFLYKCDTLYRPDDEYGVVWNDPDLKIDWTLQDPVLSSKDRNLPMLSQIEPAKLPIYRDSD
jgi:dTDP-4-dehydrorhamnose 3,5-epimerase